MLVKCAAVDRSRLTIAKCRNETSFVFKVMFSLIILAFLGETCATHRLDEKSDLKSLFFIDFRESKAANDCRNGKDTQKP